MQRLHLTIQREAGFKPGDKVELVVEDGEIRIIRSKGGDDQNTACRGRED